MAKLALLERLTSQANNDSADSSLAVSQSIVTNLLRVLRTPKNSTKIRPELGMSAYSDMGLFNEASVKDLIADIVYQIENFEPRLSTISVRADVVALTKPLQVVFVIEATYNFDSQTHAFALQLRYTAQGQFEPVSH
jgi:type VI secretion system lysozyme-like protein